jgi:excisionase family DNA binding protein
LVRRWCTSFRPIPAPHEYLITVRTVAARLGLSSASVCKLCQSGEQRGLRIGGTLRFSPQLIDEYITRGAGGVVGPTAPA